MPSPAIRQHGLHVRTDARRSADPCPAPRRPPLHDRPGSDRGDETFDSRTTVRFTVRGDQDATDTFVEVKPAELRDVTLDGHPLDPDTLDGNRLPLKNLTPGEHELSVHAAMRYSRTGEGMHRFTDPTDGETYVYTQLFLDDVQRVFAAFDQPDLKAVFDLTVTAPRAGPSSPTASPSTPAAACGRRRPPR